MRGMCVRVCVCVCVCLVGDRGEAANWTDPNGIMLSEKSNLKRLHTV